MVTSGHSGAASSISYDLVPNRTVNCLECGLLDDAMLVAAAQAGEERAFIELCARYRQRAFSMIHRVTKNREDTEDALQESMMRAFLHLKQFDGRSSFGTWFVRIGINSALMMLRKRRNRPETSIDETILGETWLTWQIADRSGGPEEHYAGYEISMRLKHAIRRLPTKLRSIVELGQMEGHSMKEIASKMGISVPAAKSRIARAKASLRKSMI
jgi:RNA polymerase sigma-70 factor (ECF subfamily)